MRKSYFKIKKLCLNLSYEEQERVLKLLYRSLLLYHAGPSILAQEITLKDLEGIIKSVERGLRTVPA